MIKRKDVVSDKDIERIRRLSGFTEVASSWTQKVLKRFFSFASSKFIFILFAVIGVVIVFLYNLLLKNIVRKHFVVS